MTDAPVFPRSGGCHCGAVRFTVSTPDEVLCQQCNCSICRRSGFVHLIVPRAAFRLEQGQEALTCYTFNTGVAQHLFCRICGIKSFYIPRSNPDGVDINLRCLDALPPQVRLEDFDGDNWEAHAHTLAHLSDASGAS